MMTNGHGWLVWMALALALAVGCEERRAEPEGFASPSSAPASKAGDGTTIRSGAAEPAIEVRRDGDERNVRVGSIHARHGADGDRDVQMGDVRVHDGAEGDRDVRVGSVHVQRSADGRRRVQVGGLVIER